MAISAIYKPYKKTMNEDALIYHIMTESEFKKWLSGNWGETTSQSKKLMPGQGEELRNGTKNIFLNDM